MPATTLNPTTLYMGDNGRMTCGTHSGATAQYTGRDLHGARMLPVTPAMRAQMAEECGMPLDAIGCEVCQARARRGLSAE